MTFVPNQSQHSVEVYVEMARDLKYIWQKLNRLLLGTGRMPHPVVGAIGVTQTKHTMTTLCMVVLSVVQSGLEALNYPELMFTLHILHSPSVV